ncbi:hypothetical protein [Streptomyces variegatus]|uniref:hypothetical protein n=1 Tax=Streptomyces variegatus TaxID=284040 RepID=UPI003C2FC66B
MQAVDATRGGGHLGYVGVNYDVALPGIELFFAGIHTLGGPTPVRRRVRGCWRWSAPLSGRGCTAWPPRSE